MIWLIWHRVFVQGDGGFEKVDLFGRSLITFCMNFGMHFYAFFFGENILPWNYLIFALGVAILVALGYFKMQAFKNKKFSGGDLFVPIMCGLFILLNTVILNILDPRYNFIVYPKYVFVAFPLFIISLVVIIAKIENKKWRNSIIAGIIIVELFGLMNFYQAKNYLNASYFNDFKGFEMVRNSSLPGDYLIISGDLNSGALQFFQSQYFMKVTPIDANSLTADFLAEPGKRFWFFATGSDDSNINNETDSKIPAGLRIVDRLDSVPLDPTLKAVKEKILKRGSYTYKYTVFLLAN